MVMDFFGNQISKCPHLMEKSTLVLGYSLKPSSGPSNKQFIKYSFLRSPCMCKQRTGMHAATYDLVVQFLSIADSQSLSALQAPQLRGGYHSIARHNSNNGLTSTLQDTRKSTQFITRNIHQTCHTSTTCYIYFV